jgi:hypothetical protein
MRQVTPFDASPFWFSPSRGPASVLSHGIEGSPNKEGKEFVKIVDGLANVATTKHDGWHLRPSISAPPDRVHMISMPGGCTVDFVNSHTPTLARSSLALARRDYTLGLIIIARSAFDLQMPYLSYAPSAWIQCKHKPAKARPRKALRAPTTSRNE